MLDEHGAPREVTPEELQESDRELGALIGYLEAMAATATISHTEYLGMPNKLIQMLITLKLTAGQREDARQLTLIKAMAKMHGAKIRE